MATATKLDGSSYTPERETGGIYTHCGIGTVEVYGERLMVVRAYQISRNRLPTIGAPWYLDHVRGWLAHGVAFSSCIWAGDAAVEAAETEGKLYLGRMSPESIPGRAEPVYIAHCCVSVCHWKNELEFEMF